MTIRLSVNSIIAPGSGVVESPGSGLDLNDSLFSGSDVTQGCSCSPVILAERTNDAWTEKGIVIGQPVTQIRLGGPGQEPEEVLWNPIRLSPSQTKAVLELLVRNEATLRKMGEEEEELRAKTLGKVYSRLLRLAEEKDRNREEANGG